MLIDKKFLERHRANEGCKAWWLRNKLDFLHYKDLDKKITGDFRGYIQWLKNLRLDRCKFDKDGNMISETNSLGFVTNWAYDKAGNKISQTNPDGGIINWTYDEDGNMINKIYSSGYAFNWTYDKNNNKISQIDSGGDVREWVYDKAGNKISETHSSSVIKWAYDEDGNMISQTYPDDSAIMWAYDKNGNMTNQTDTDGDTYKRTYDKNNNITRKTYPNGGFIDWTYDEAGNKISQTNLSQYKYIPKHTTWEYTNNKEAFIVLENDKEILRIDKKPNNEANYNVIQNQVSHYREMYERETKLLDIIVVYCKSQIKENTKINAENKKLKKKLNRRKLC